MDEFEAGNAHKRTEHLAYEMSEKGPVRLARRKLTGLRRPLLKRLGGRKEVIFDRKRQIHYATDRL